MREQYRLTWSFPDGRRLTRLVHCNDERSATIAASADDYQRPIFRRAGFVTRSASACEYLDRFPVPSAVNVERC